MRTEPDDFGFSRGAGRPKNNRGNLQAIRKRGLDQMCIGMWFGDAPWEIGSPFNPVVAALPRVLLLHAFEGDGDWCIESLRTGLLPLRPAGLGRRTRFGGRLPKPLPGKKCHAAVHLIQLHRRAQVPADRGVHEQSLDAKRAVARVSGPELAIGRQTPRLGPHSHRL